MAVIVEQAVAMHSDVVHAGVAAHEDEGVLEVFGVEVGPLALVAPLGDGVELVRAVVARRSHGFGEARGGPRCGI